MFNISYLFLYLVQEKEIQCIKKKMHKIHSGTINFPDIYLRDI